MENGKRCWEILNCSKTECPVRGSDREQCWLVPETHFREKMQCMMFGKIEMCFNCPVFKSGMNVRFLEETIDVAKNQLTRYREMVEEQDKELEEISMELAVSFSEVFEALRGMAEGDPTVRISEDSKLELIRKLKSMVNLTAENLAEFVDLCHEFAIGLAEHFDVLHKVSKGNLDARIKGTSSVELLESLKKVTNQTIDSVEREIARRKRAREELVRYTEELKRRNEEVMQFAFIVSHDLRSPLVNLKGFVGELKLAFSQVRDAVSEMFPQMEEADRDVVENALNQDIPEALGFIDSSVERMDVFINAVLKLSRLGRIRLHPIQVETGALVREILKALAHRIEKHNISVTLKDLPNLFADNIALEQIFGNLLANATAYLDPQRPGKITVTGHRNGSDTIFQIKDNGIGISEEDMPMVFAPFKRAANPSIPGEGMGLAYVQTLIRRCGGSITCESVPGEGSVFTFAIPDSLPPDE